MNGLGLPLHFCILQFIKNWTVEGLGTRLHLKFCFVSLPLLTHPGIVEYMRRQAGPSSTPLASVAEVRGFVNSRETRVVGFFSGDTSSHLLDEFKESGNLVREDVRLGHTTDRQVAKGMGFPEDSVVVFYPK